MPRDINTRLEQLNKRRKGTDRLNRVETASVNDLLAKSLLTETWQKRAVSQPYTRYALGAMQAVGETYTRVSIETADRVARQLMANLSIGITTRLQGSVPLDVHIRGVSDVDLLAIREDFLTYATHGSRASTYRSPTTRSSSEVLLELRRESEKVLKAAYPAANVDCSGGKCISLSGGSLARPVDIVPSHWHDTIAYQASQQEHDRGVTILDKKMLATIDNLPFLHIKRVHDRDLLVWGGLKKAIRLTKNVKNDAEDASGASQLPSFDIAALLYHADQTALKAGFYFELAVLKEARRFFDWCYHNKEKAKSLATPDGSRFILDNQAKFSGLMTISVELDNLAKEVAREQLRHLMGRDPTWPEIEYALEHAVIPQVA